MALPKYKFKCWCEKAVSGIISPPDQRTVYQELMDHMEDRYDTLREQGLEDEIAQQQVVESMGDPWPIAKDLAQIHRPFWGYFLRATRVILVIVLVISLIPVGRYLWYKPYSQPMYPRFHFFEDTYFEDEHGTVQRTLYTEPDKTITAGGYRLTLTKAAQHHLISSDAEIDEDDRFCFQFRVFNPVPWAGAPEFLYYLWAEDSLGNRYNGWMDESAAYGEPRVIVNEFHTSPLTYTMNMYLSPFCSQEADWIALHYTRDGRDLTFYIDLTGGNAP